MFSGTIESDYWPRMEWTEKTEHDNKLINNKLVVIMQRFKFEKWKRLYVR